MNITTYALVLSALSGTAAGTGACVGAAAVVRFPAASGPHCCDSVTFCIMVFWLAGETLISCEQLKIVWLHAILPFIAARSPVLMMFTCLHAGLLQYGKYPIFAASAVFMKHAQLVAFWFKSIA